MIFTLEERAAVSREQSQNVVVGIKKTGTYAGF